MTARLVSLEWDALDPARLARFWAAALGWTATGPALAPTDGVTSFDITFVPTSAPKVGRNRIHLDLTTRSLDDQQASASQLAALGASFLDVGQGPDATHVVLADPEGNELCLIEPTNRFLAGCPRLGALSCDGSRAVGLFWSAALGWPLVWDEGEETAIRSPDGTGPIISWGGGPELPKIGRNRLRLAVDADADSLVALGARRLDDGSLVDPDDNEIDLR
jgi:hypothetical protein